MRIFIALCLVAIASADKLGYNYKPVGHSDAGLSFQPGALPQALNNAAPASYSSDLSGGANLGYGNSLGGSVGGVAQAPQGLSLHPGVSGSVGLGFSSVSSGSADSSLSGVAAPVALGAPVAPVAQVSEYTKEFYSFSAPEEQFNDVDNLQQNIESNLQKHLRVIFIKGPENQALENAALALAKHSSDQRTAIYVLQKQPDLANLASKLNSVGSNNNPKPEVHFIKYRTQEDAANAQQTIQSQYDSLSGTSQSFSGESAPVLNFASQPAAELPAAVPAQASASAPVANAPAPANSYLPANFIRF